MRWKEQVNFTLIISCLFVQLNFAQEDKKDETDAKEESAFEEDNYESPQVDLSQFYFIEHFDDADKSEAEKWIKSNAKKDDTAEEIAKYDGIWKFESPERIVWKNDLGLVLKSKAKHAAISSRLMKKFKFTDKPLVVQYEVTMQTIQDCGGSYIKLLSDGPSSLDLTQFNDKTPYTIMFGPDKCGNDIKLHFIFRHVNPINGSISEKHSRKPKERLEEPFKDKLPHLYRLVVNPDNTFQVSVDHKIVNEGSLLNDFQPPVNPPKEIDDPNDKKPDNWDEREKIPDPDAVKPDDWDEDAPAQILDPSAIMPSGWLEDEPEMVADPNAKKPDDWDTEIDGDWEAPLIDNPICEKASGCGEWKPPLIDNPSYQGKWRAPLIDNPNYQGKWSPRKIQNPDFFEDLNPFHMTPIGAVGIEIWSMSSDILFDNIIITDDVEIANDYSEKTFDLKRKYINKESESVFSKLVHYTNENPWLWGIYIVVIGTPLSFVFYTLCCARKESTLEEDIGESKKTDEPSPDDEGSLQNEPVGKAQISKKSDLDIKVTDYHSDEEEVEIIDNNEIEANEENAVDQPKTEDIQPPSDGGTRKRRPRKE